MTDKIPEALAVLDDVLSFAGDDVLPYTAARLRKTRAAFAELVESAKEMESDAAILGMGCRRMNAALAAVEKLP